MHKRKIFTALLLAITLLVSTVSPALALPPLPSSFLGTVKLDGANVPAGTVISARINGVEYASTVVQLYNGDTVYSLDVPGDDPATPPDVEGGVANDTVVFFIGSQEADQVGTWSSGTNVELNLTATSPLPNTH